MTRRDLLLAPAALLAPSALAAPLLGPSRLSILTDEVGSLQDAITFAKRYGLTWVELRQEPGDVYYDKMPAAKLKETARILAGNGLRVSLLNSALLKFTLPGTKAVKWEDFYENMYKKEGLTAEGLFRDRLDHTKRAVDAAHLLGVDQIRSFTFWRVAEPRGTFGAIRDSLGAMAEIAAKAKVRILVENEYATNTASSSELAEVLAKLPSKAIAVNWDPQNSTEFDWPLLPGGYDRLPKERIANVQIKAEGLIGPGKKLDWAGIVRRLLADGYKGKFGLETHTLKAREINLRASHDCMAALLALTT